MVAGQRPTSLVECCELAVAVTVEELCRHYNIPYNQRNVCVHLVAKEDQGCIFSRLSLSMDKTPSTALHRVLTSLNWSRSVPGRGDDGDVKSKTEPLTGDKTYSLKK